MAPGLSARTSPGTIWSCPAESTSVSADWASPPGVEARHLPGTPLHLPRPADAEAIDRAMAHR